MGLSDVWVSEHIIVPRAQFPRSPLFYDPILTLTWVASVTERVRLGTSVIVLPMRHPLPLAKELATLHNFSEGRLILGAGVGWLQSEFAALGVPFAERGRRLDEGLAMMRAVHGSTVLYPSDGTSTAALVDVMAGTSGISYLRTTRGSYPGLYPAWETFPVGGSKVLRSGDNDQVTLVGAGVTLHEALHAAEVLGGEGIAARVIDCYSVKPLDAETLAAAAEATGGRIVVAGTCIQPDPFMSVAALMKEVTIRFAVYYAPQEFRAVIDAFTSGAIDPGPLVGATMGIGALDEGFDALAAGSTLGKILIEPT